MIGFEFRDTFENVRLVVKFGDACFFDLESNVFLKNSISSQPYGRGSAVAKLVNDFVSIAVQPVISMSRMQTTRAIAVGGALRYAARLPQYVATQ